VQLPLHIKKYSGDIKVIGLTYNQEKEGENMTILLLIIIYIAFISLGLPDSMLGAAWPTIRANLFLPIAGAGLISMIISGGTIASSLFSGKLIKKLGTGKLTLISVFMTAMALLGFSFSKNYLWLCMMAIPLGLGAGSVDAALNNFVALHFSARHMSWLHCFWGIGATAGPIIMAAAISQEGSWQKGYLSVAVVQACLVIILLVSLPLWKSFYNNVQEDVIIKDKNQHLFQLPGIRTALIGFFCYCALESTAGLWGASYLVQTKGVAADVAAGWISIYYLGITIGRLINGFITAKFSNPALIRGGQFIIGIGAILLMIFNQTYINLLGLILIGIGCAPIYPSMLHETPVRFGKNNSGKLMGVQMAFAYIGTTLVPPALGLLSGRVGIQFYPVYILVLLLVMFVSSEKINKIVARKLTNQ
jgi:fucose permease